MIVAKLTMLILYYKMMKYPVNEGMIGKKWNVKRKAGKVV